MTRIRKRFRKIVAAETGPGSLFRANLASLSLLQWISARARTWRSIVLVGVIRLACFGAASPVAAATQAEPVREQARLLATAGYKAYAAGDFRTAHEQFEKSFGLLRVPSLGLWSARALVKLGRFVDAERRYRTVALLQVGPADSPVQSASKVDAALELESLLPRIASLSFRLAGVARGGLEVQLDGRALGGEELGRVQRIDPGRHVVVGQQGSERIGVVLDLAEGEHEELWLRFAGHAAGAAKTPMEATGGAPARPDRTLAALHVAGGITLAAGGVSAVTGVMAYAVSRDEHAKVDRLAACSSPSCLAASPEAYRAYQSWRTLCTVGLLAGGLLSAAGVTLLIAGHGDSNAEERAAQLGLRIGPASAALVGSF